MILCPAPAAPMINPSLRLIAVHGKGDLRGRPAIKAAGVDPVKVEAEKEAAGINDGGAEASADDQYGHTGAEGGRGWWRGERRGEFRSIGWI